MSERDEREGAARHSWFNPHTLRRDTMMATQGGPVASSCFQIQLCFVEGLSSTKPKKSNKSCSPFPGPSPAHLKLSKCTPPQDKALCCPGGTLIVSLNEQWVPTRTWQMKQREIQVVTREMAQIRRKNLFMITLCARTKLTRRWF